MKAFHGVREGTTARISSCKIISYVVKWLFVTHSLRTQPFASELQKSKHVQQQNLLGVFLFLYLSAALDCANSLFIQSF